jgi:tetratricopeptide (TPR) repeat protein
VNRGLWAQRLQAASLLAVVALTTAAPLVPCESAAILGSHVVFDMLWLLVLATWAFSCWLRPRPVLHLGITGIVVIAFVFVHALSAIVMGGAGHARPALNMLWQYVGYAAAFFVIRQVARNGMAIRAICSALIALALSLAALGFYQYFVSMPADVAAFEKDPEAVMRSAGISAPEGSPERRQFADRIRSKEPIATFALANSLAGFLTPCLVLVVGLAGWDRLREHPWRLVAGALLIAAPLAGCLLLTKSRSAFVGVTFGVIGVTIWDFVRRRLPRWPVLLGAALGLGCLLLLATWVGGLDRQVLTEAPKSLLYRMQYWRATVGMIADYPGLGCGPGNFKECYTRYKLPEASESITDPHNFLLEICATAGVPAFMVFAGIAGAALIQIRRRRPGAEAITPDVQLNNIPVLVYSGLAVGVVAAVPVGALSGFPINFELLLLCLPASGIAIWLLHRWVLSGQLAVSVLTLALTALLINLLAAGGIGYPGVGHLVWVLLALLINLSEIDLASTREESTKNADSSSTGDTKPGASDSTRRWPGSQPGRRAVGGVLALAVLLLAACFYTGYRPVLAAHKHITNAMSSRDWREAEREYQAATVADPWWAEPWELLADLSFQRWRQSTDSTARRVNLEQFEQFSETARNSDPHSSRLHRRCGDWLLEMYQRTEDGELGGQAVDAYRRAVELYPNSGILHAQLAWALHLIGLDDESAEEAERALALNRLTPHEEYWLQNQQLTGSPPIETSSGPPTAEQLMLKLRKSDKRG